MRQHYSVYFRLPPDAGVNLTLAIPMRQRYKNRLGRRVLS